MSASPQSYTPNDDRFTAGVTTVDPAVAAASGDRDDARRRGGIGGWHGRFA